MSSNTSDGCNVEIVEVNGGGGNRRQTRSVAPCCVPRRVSHRDLPTYSCCLTVAALLHRTAHQVLQLQALANEHVACAEELASLRDKAARSYARQRDAIGLAEAARRTADTPAITETLQMFEFAAALYEEQAARHVALTARVCTDRPDAVDAVDAAWDSAIHRNAHVVSRMLRETTSVDRSSAA